MRTLFNNMGRAVAVGACAVALAAVGYASTTYVNDGPLTNQSAFNNATSSSRSNVDWTNSGNQIYGDSFTVGTAGNSYLLDSVSVFIVLINGDTPADFTSETLYGGTSGDYTTSDCQNGNCPFTIQSTSATFSSSPVTVPGAGSGCTGYLPTSGSPCLSIYEVTFATNWLVQGGVTYGFAADGTGSPWNNLTENAALAGWSTGNIGILGQFLNWETDSVCGSGSDSCLPFGYATVNSSGGTAPTCTSDPNPSDVCAGWDKTTNMDVIVTGDLVAPEPGSLVLSGLGIGALGLIAFRRRKASLKTAAHTAG